MLCKERLKFIWYVFMHSVIQDLLPALDRIATALEAAAQPATAEGFFEYSQKVFCNVAKGNGDGWYTLKDGVATTLPPIAQGKVLNISFPTVERNGKGVCKFHLLMSIDGDLFKFESGFDCYFSKTILATFAAASPEVLTQPVKLSTYSKVLRTGDKTLAVSIRSADGVKLSSEWSNDDDWKMIATLAIENVKAAND